MCRQLILASALAAAVLACAPPPENGPDGAPEPEANCAYPITDRMALDEPIPPYAWAEARDPAGEITRLDLADVHHEQGLSAKLLAFVAIPAW
jgi:hypothetical protein